MSSSAQEIALSGIILGHYDIYYIRRDLYNTYEHLETMTSTFHELQTYSQGNVFIQEIHMYINIRTLKMWTYFPKQLHYIQFKHLKVIYCDTVTIDFISSMNFEHLKKTLGYVQEIITARQHGVKNLWNKYNEAKLTEQILI